MSVIDISTKMDIGEWMVKYDYEDYLDTLRAAQEDKLELVLEFVTFLYREIAVSLLLYGSFEQKMEFSKHLQRATNIHLYREGIRPRVEQEIRIWESFQNMFESFYPPGFASEEYTKGGDSVPCVTEIFLLNKALTKKRIEADEIRVAEYLRSLVKNKTLRDYIIELEVAERILRSGVGGVTDKFRADEADLVALITRQLKNDWISQIKISVNKSSNNYTEITYTPRQIMSWGKYLRKKFF